VTREEGGGVPDEVFRMTVEILELLRISRITGAREGVLGGHGDINILFVGKPLLQGVVGGFASPEIPLP